MSETYTLLLRSDAGHARAAEREGLIAHLTRIPGVVERGPDRYAFGDEDEHGIMELDVFVRRDGARVEPEDVRDDEAATVHEVEVRVPRPWVMEHGPRVFALVFMLAEWAEWEVFDPQIDDRLQKEAVLSGLVAMRQAQREQEARKAGESEQLPGDPPPLHSDYQPSAPPPSDTNGDAKPRRRPWWKKG
jgi:hypothetical protein